MQAAAATETQSRQNERLAQQLHPPKSEKSHVPKSLSDVN